MTWSQRRKPSYKKEKLSDSNSFFCLGHQKDSLRIIIYTYKCCREHNHHDDDTHDSHECRKQQCRILWCEHCEFVRRNLLVCGNSLVELTQQGTCLGKRFVVFAIQLFDHLVDLRALNHSSVFGDGDVDGGGGGVRGDAYMGCKQMFLTSFCHCDTVCGCVCVLASMGVHQWWWVLMHTLNAIVVFNLKRERKGWRWWGKEHKFNSFTHLRINHPSSRTNERSGGTRSLDDIISLAAKRRDRDRERDEHAALHHTWGVRHDDRQPTFATNDGG